MNPKRSILVLAALALPGVACLDAGDGGNLVPKTVTEDPSLPQLALNGTHVHAESFGDPGAPAIIALHGGPGSDYRSMLNLAALAGDGYHVVFWDQRGAGLSERHDGGTYTYAVYLVDLRQLVERTVAPGQPFVFIGHSWGAMYATWFANEYGDYGGRLRGAILSDPGGFTKKELDEFIDRYFASVSLTGEQFNDALWSEQFLSADDHARADYLQMLMALKGVPAEHHDPAHLPPMWREGAVVNAALVHLSEVQPFDFTTHLASFTHHVLFLRSELDTATTLASQQQLAAHYPDAGIVTIKGAGHEMIYEAPAEYLARTRDYFQTIGFLGGAK